MKIDIVRDEVKSLDIDHLKALSLNPNDWQAAGVSEYRLYACLLYTSPSPRDVEESRMPSSA